MFLGCQPCCEQQQPMHAALTMTGFQRFLHGYNMSTSHNNLSFASSYIDGQPTQYAPMLAPLYPGTTFLAAPPSDFGPTCGTYSLASQICPSNYITFTDDDVSLAVTLSTRTATGGAASTCTATYKKPRSGFWENKFASGIFYFLPEDLFSFSSDSADLESTDVGTTVVVQRPLLPNGAVAWANAPQYPLRFETEIAGTPVLGGPQDFAGDETRVLGTSTLTSNRIILFGGLYRIFAPFLCGVNDLTPVAGWFISPHYWEAFSVDGVLVVTGVGVQFGVFPGAYATFDCSIFASFGAGTIGVGVEYEAASSTLTVTQL